MRKDSGNGYQIKTLMRSAVFGGGYIAVVGGGVGGGVCAVFFF